ncbi:DNA-binding transcriptional regulator, MarR family [Frankia canadensis]|uniref:DNA-binding transcriptional regulator, MarR family n=1 Tax=Frankia canadensis TaxID=1836972 RepID=A0A2I2KIP2_9ACTN|nr:MarR family transcriptional regulator [Frankia canadensis]SNQ45538.1 DNA-binding transcriptional regulator, MarR family [Frankia canadensis]SOU52828.1 DNA-binding transcriptional regulator, MarR family [Frankia canadensis]
MASSHPVSPSGAGGETPADWELGLVLASAHQVWRARTATALAQAGFGDLRPPDVQLLRLVEGGVATVGELAALFTVSKQAVSKVVDTLVGRDYLTRFTDRADRRRAPLALTPRAREAIRVVGRRREADQRILRDQLGEAGVRALRDGLAAVVALAPDQEVVLALAQRLADAEPARSG